MTPKNPPKKSRKGKHGMRLVSGGAHAMDPVLTMAQALTRLVGANSYVLLKNLDARAFLAGRNVKLPDDPRIETVGTLVALGAAEIASILQGKERTLKELTQAFYDLAGEQKELGAAAPVSQEFREAQREEGGEGLPLVHSSMDAEKKLASLLQKIVSSPGFARAKGKLLSDYWDERWPKAPFEQCLSIQQLTQLKPDTLIKKKSLGVKKISAILAALEKFLLQEGEGSLAPATVQKPDSKRIDAPLRTGHLWPHSVSLPSFARSLLSFYELQTEIAAQGSSFKALLEAIPRSLSPRDFLLLWMSNDAETSVAGGLLRLSDIEAREGYDSGLAKLSALLRAEHSAMLKNWKVMLNGPGVFAGELFETYRDGHLDLGFQESVLTLCAATIGAVHPHAFGVLFDQYLTATPEALERILGMVVRSMPRSEVQLRDDLKVALGQFTFESLLPALRNRAALKAGKWHPR